MKRALRFGSPPVLIALFLFFGSGVFTDPSKASSLPPEDCDTTADLVPLVTDQTALPLSNKFGVLSGPVMNDNGDLAFMGAGQTAMFYRAAGSSAPVRIMQAGDEAPGYPGSRVDLFQAPRINSSGSVVFRVDFARADGTFQNALMKFDGTTLSTLVTGDEVAPGSGGATFDRSFNLWGLNDSGDIAFTAFPGSGTPGNSAVSALFIKPASGAPVRVVGTGDHFPGSSRLLTNIVQPAGSNLMNSGEIHLGTNLNEEGFLGILVGSATGVRAVAEGQTFTSQNSKLNNAGEVVYFSNLGEQVMKHTAAGGSVRIFGRGDAVFSSTINGPGILIRELNDAGDVLFSANIQSGGSALFRKRGDDTSQVVEDDDLIARTGDAAPGIGGRTIGTFGTASMDASGNVGFQADMAGGPALSGVFRKMAGQPVAKVASNGDASPTGGGATLQIPATTVQTKAGGSVSFGSNVIGGAADFAYLRYTGPGAGAALSNNGEDLPAGARQSFRSFRVSGAGDKVGFFAQLAGGRRSIVVHNITTNTTSVLATDGDAAPGTPDPAIFRIGTINSVPLADSGRIVFLGTLVGVNRVGGTGLFTSKPGEAVSKVVITGVDSVGGRIISTAQINTLTPSSISPNGIVAFQGNSLGPPATQATIYTWSETSGLARIAGVSDVVSPGGTITALTAGLAVNNAGQVAFRASLNGSAGALLIGSPTGSATKIVAPGDAWPSGGTFAGTGVPDLNDNGDVVFMASAAGSPAKAGAFVWNGGGSPVLLAENGGASPAGGAYAMTVARPDLAINNSGDILLRSDLTGGTTNSAIFVRRGPAGVLQSVATQGQDAPGTEGQFELIQFGLNGLPEEQFQLDELGNIAFQNVYSDGTTRAFGNWRIKPDNTSEEILVRGVVRPEFGGGAAVTSTASISWNSGSRYPIWARVTGGNFTEGIFLSVPKVCNDTPAGNDVPVTVVDSTTGEAPLSMTFDSVTSPGETTLTTSAGGPTVPTAFQIGDPPLFFNIETTATFSGFIEICLDVSGVTFPSGGNIRLLHFENNRWKDITTSGPTGGIICGRTRSLSPFTVAEQTAPYDETPPTLNPTVEPNPILLNGTATASANADDGGGSGVASQSCGELDTTSVGTKSVTCTATDNEGNTESATISYRVIYDFTGFFQPVDNLPALNTAKAGSGIPVKFSLAGNQGLGVLAGSPTSSQIACDASDPGSEIEETSSAGGSGLSYDASTDQYTYVWKTNKAWKGSCRLLNVKFIDGNEYRAKFRFN
jgi:hypothetical protein